MVKNRANFIINENKSKGKYKNFDFLNNAQMKNAAGVANIIVSRAGSGLFEIATWGIPSILIPITNTNLDHQKKNAFNYARVGACSVIEEVNMTANILISEIERILSDKVVYDRMAKNAKSFNKENAAEVIAQELVNISLKHEK